MFESEGNRENNVCNIQSVFFAIVAKYKYVMGNAKEGMKEFPGINGTGSIQDSNSHNLHIK